VGFSRPHPDDERHPPPWTPPGRRDGLYVAALDRGADQRRSNTEIAADLTISIATVKTYVTRLLTKLDARDRVQLVIIAYDAGLVTPAG
jgi:DNA-binding CsgD family transcriptional regulator